MAERAGSGPPVLPPRERDERNERGAPHGYAPLARDRHVSASVRAQFLDELFELQGVGGERADAFRELFRRHRVVVHEEAER